MTERIIDQEEEEKKERMKNIFISQDTVAFFIARPILILISPKS